MEQSDFQKGNIVFEKDPLGLLASFPIPYSYCEGPRIETRTCGPYAGRALYLDGHYDWKLLDEEGRQMKHWTTGNWMAVLFLTAVALGVLAFIVSVLLGDDAEMREGMGIILMTLGGVILFGLAMAHFPSRWD